MWKTTLILKWFIKPKFSARRTGPNFFLGIFLKFKLLDVHAINKFQTGSFMYRCFDKSSIFPQHFRNYFILNKDIHSYATRNANRVHINKVRTTTRKQTLKHSGPMFWNALDKYITEAATLFIFQARLRSHILKYWV